MAENYNWVLFFEKLLSKICKLSNDNTKASKLLYEYFKQLPENNYDFSKYEQMDPLTYIACVSRNIQNINKANLDFNIGIELKKKGDGIPSFDPRGPQWVYAKELFYSSTNDSSESVFDNLWDFAREINNENFNESLFNKLLEYNSITAAKLSKIIFICKPNIYYSCDKNMANYINHKIPNNYYEFLNFQNICKQNYKNKKPYSLSYEAWLSRDLKDENEDTTKKTWLLTWNPNKWHWESFEKDIDNVDKGIDVESKYSCHSKKPRIGDRAFVLKLGENLPKGIIASGYVSHEPYMDIAEHTDDNKEMNCIKIKFDKIINFNQNDVLLQDILKKELPGQEWSPQSSGIEVKREIADKLEELWQSVNDNSKSLSEVNMSYENVNNIPLNQILYGPPGTGKTYNTVVEAMKILDNELYLEYENLEIDKKLDFYKNRLVTEFNRIKNEEKRIEFVTFHQSYSYEEFVEGIKPVLKKNNDLQEDKNQQISYECKDGIFKDICEHAKPVVTTSIKHEPIDFSNTKVFKMSLGNTLEKEDDIYDYCIENNVVSLGWKDVDFSNCKTSQDFKNLDDSWGATALERFVKWMDIGDIIIISNGNRNFRAIAQVKSDYIYDKNTPISHTHFRKVEWLYKGEDIHYSKINDKIFSQQSIYGYFSPSKKGQQDYNPDLKTDELNKIITGEVNKEVSKPHILIIDEINRGNISKIFGELITLIEKDKRGKLSVKLPYSQKPFTVPQNLYIIGTMNTSDRSIASIDIALRRRFIFKEIMPDVNLVPDIEVFGIELRKIFTILNERISILLDRDHQIGHSYFMKINNETDFERVWFDDVLPLLNEYFYGDWEKLCALLGDFQPEGKSFIKKINNVKFANNYSCDEDETYDFVSEANIDFESAIKNAFSVSTKKQISEEDTTLEE